MKVIAADGDRIGVVLTREEAAIVAAALSRESVDITERARNKYGKHVVPDVNKGAAGPLYLVFDPLDEFAKGMSVDQFVDAAGS